MSQHVETSPDLVPTPSQHLKTTVSAAKLRKQRAKALARARNRLRR